MDSDEIIQRCKRGDEEAFEAFILHFSPQVYRIARAVMDDPYEGSEAAQDALVSALMAFRTFSELSSLSTWVYSIVLNECRSRLRRRRAREKLLQVVSAFWRIEMKTPSGPEESLVQREEKRQVWTAIQSLGDIHRIPVLLRYYEGLTIHDISQILCINEGTVHSRLNTARLRLRGLLARNQEETHLHLVNGG